MSGWAEDPVNPLEFVATCFALAVPAMYAGKFVDRTVGDRGLFVRIFVNSLVLYSVFMLLPWDIVSNFQSTLPGVLACAIYMNTQRWT